MRRLGPDLALACFVSISSLHPARLCPFVGILEVAAMENSTDSFELYAADIEAMENLMAEGEWDVNLAGAEIQDLLTAANLNVADLAELESEPEWVFSDASSRAVQIGAGAVRRVLEADGGRADDQQENSIQQLAPDLDNDGVRVPAFVDGDSATPERVAGTRVPVCEFLLQRWPRHLLLMRCGRVPMREGWRS